MKKINVEFRFLQQRALITACAIAMAIIPVWAVTYPPITDLPQHLAQMALLQQIDSNAQLELAPWYYPNTLVYLPIYILWQFFGPLTAGKITVSILIAASIATTRWLVTSMDRPVEGWALALPLTFSLSLYWGFLNFLIGWPIYCAFLVVANQTFSRRQTIALSALAVFLYWSHALWFLCGAITLGLLTIHQFRQAALPRALAFLPTGLMALAWYPIMSSFRAASGFPVAPVWRTGIFERFSLNMLPNALLGGSPNIMEEVITILVCGWLALSVIQHRRQLVAESSRTLLFAGGLMLVGYAVLPTKAVNTIHFNSRWLPFGTTLLLLALPAPQFRYVSVRGMHIFLAALFTLFVGITVSHWRAHEKEYMAGFDEALALLSPGDTVLGLTYFSDSPYVGGAPQMQAVAWAQAIHGATTNFSFAEHHSGIVNYRTPRNVPWRNTLVWSPARARQTDTQHFDKVLVSGDDYVQQQYSTSLRLTRLTPENPSAMWHLYRPSN
jgi:hypothetical protein